MTLGIVSDGEMDIICNSTDISYIILHDWLLT